jgi:hypothetical protein
MFVIVEPHTFNGAFRMSKASQIANDLVMVLIRHLENKIVKIEEQLSLLTKKKTRASNGTWAKEKATGYKPKLTKKDLIGTAKFLNKSGNQTEVGIENYVIFPSGNIKYYFRAKNSDGTFGYMFTVWDSNKKILALNIKKMFVIKKTRKAV